MLPEQFLYRMEKMLGEEYPEFTACYDRPRHQSLRINTLKKNAEQLAGSAGFTGEPVPWAKGGFYYDEEQRPGKHPYHEAGLYYIQEASAMAPGAGLKAQPGDRILDLCAAPGGKSTQLAADMNGQGLLVCNEIHPARARILSENIERMGIRNALVLNHEPAVIARHFPEYFDRIMVDAPCSGEGMFRKNEETAAEWSQDNVQLCAQRQDDILEYAQSCLKPGGRLMYSTCTFAPAEDEGTISRFLSRHPEFSTEEIHICPGMEPGNPDWAEAAARGIENTVRLWPHRLKGEGHFMALLKKAGERTANIPGMQQETAFRECGEFAEFKEKYLKCDLRGNYLKFGEQLYLAPADMPSLKGLKVLRPGLHLGTLKKNRFEPSHALALTLEPEDAAYTSALSIQEAEKYLRGYALRTESFQETACTEKERKGWHLITIDGCSLGWGKLAGGMMKNHYPKGLRKSG